MSDEIAGCTFETTAGGWSFSIARYCGPATLGANRQMVQIRLASLDGAEDLIVQMRPLEFRRVLRSMTVADAWLRERESRA